MPTIRRALISVSDKTGVVAFARRLHALQIEILSTGGTAAALRTANIPVVDVSDYTGFPEILDGRLKTLHPKIHGGLLARRDNPRHAEAMAEFDIPPIDLVVVNLYPFAATITQAGCTLAEAMEQIDIGGPTMLRAAAKNWQDVAAVVDPADYVSLGDELERTGGSLSTITTFRLAQKVFALTARYDAAIATYLSTYEGTEKRRELPHTFAAVFEQVQTLRYGENPHQRAAFYREVTVSTEPSLVHARQLHGKELSYNNIMDTDAALDIIKELSDTPYAAVIVKHANPCGVATSPSSLADAFAKARASDPVSAFGGIVAVNQPIDVAAAKALAEVFFEVIAAPGFAAAALDILQQKKNIRLLEVPGLEQACAPTGFTLRKVSGGLLLQDRDVSREKIRDARVVTQRRPTDAEWQTLEFAWRVARHVKSNAIVLAIADRTIGIGAGQMSRVDAVKLAVMKYDRTTARLNDCTVLASDAFFPFRDGIDEAAKAKVSAIVQPGGSVKDDEVIQAANEHGLAMVFTGVRHFLH